jgi:hypothetical protein
MRRMRLRAVIVVGLALSGCEDKRCAESARTASTTAPAESSAPTALPAVRVDNRCWQTEYGLEVISLMSVRITSDEDAGATDSAVLEQLRNGFHMVYSAQCNLVSKRCRVASLMLLSLESGETMKRGELDAEEDQQVTKLSESRFRIAGKFTGVPTEIDLAAGTVRAAEDSKRDHYRAEGTCVPKPPPIRRIP